MLEARTVCSGATGRNGGHILETADDYAEFADIFGVDAARKVIRFRLAHLKEMLAVAEELDITTETQARKVQFLSVYFGDEPWKAALERMHRFKEGMPEEAAEWTSYEGDAIPRVR
jgi:glycine/D-amino acid oxidase-like deaminating enzyme